MKATDNSSSYMLTTSCTNRLDKYKTLIWAYMLRRVDGVREKFSHELTAHADSTTSVKQAKECASRASIPPCSTVILYLIVQGVG